MTIFFSRMSPQESLVGHRAITYENDEPVNGVFAKPFVIQLHWLGWDYIQLGFHICFSMPNIEFHIPFCFIRVGWHEQFVKDTQ